jgi:hypothetical protein
MMITLLFDIHAVVYDVKIAHYCRLFGYQNTISIVVVVIEKSKEEAFFDTPSKTSAFSLPSAREEA